MKKYWASIVGLGLFILIVSCESKGNKNQQFVEKHIVLTNLKEDTKYQTIRYTSVQVLKSYPLLKACNGSNRFASLYVCKTRLTPKSDTLYIFSECNDNSIAVGDTTSNIEKGFYSRDIKKAHSSDIVIFAPKEFHIPQNAKYIFSKITGNIL